MTTPGTGEAAPPLADQSLQSDSGGFSSRPYRFPAEGVAVRGA